MTETELKETIARIAPPDEAARAAAHAHWAKLAKPLGGLGRLETMIEDAAALTGREDIDVSRRAVFVLCADNGVVVQGVSQTDQSVTRAVAENLARAHHERLPDGGDGALRRCARGYRHGGGEGARRAGQAHRRRHGGFHAGARDDARADNRRD